MNKRIIYYKNLFESINQEKQIQTYKSLKEEMLSFYKLVLDKKEDFKIIEEIWGFIKKGLLNKNGNIRNHAFYTFKRFRGISLIFNSGFELNVMEELYELSLKETNPKIKQTLLRSIIEMKCIALEFQARDFGIFDKYCEIMDYAFRETKGRYEKPKTKKEELIEQLGRNIMTLIRIEESCEK